MKSQSEVLMGHSKLIPATTMAPPVRGRLVSQCFMRAALRASSLCALLRVSAAAAAQSSPFMTGATALQSNILAWLTPIAVILVMALGAMAMANRMSWRWCIAAILGIAIAFGAPQIVSWVRGMFGV